MHSVGWMTAPHTAVAAEKYDVVKVCHGQLSGRALASNSMPYVAMTRGFGFSMALIAGHGSRTKNEIR